MYCSKGGSGRGARVRSCMLVTARASVAAVCFTSNPHKGSTRRSREPTRLLVVGHEAGQEGLQVEDGLGALLWVQQRTAACCQGCASTCQTHAGGTVPPAISPTCVSTAELGHRHTVAAQVHRACAHAWSWLSCIHANTLRPMATEGLKARLIAPTTPPPCGRPAAGQAFETRAPGTNLQAVLIESRILGSRVPQLVVQLGHQRQAQLAQHNLEAGWREAGWRFLRGGSRRHERNRLLCCRKARREGRRPQTAAQHGKDAGSMWSRDVHQRPCHLPEPEFLLAAAPFALPPHLWRYAVDQQLIQLAAHLQSGGRWQHSNTWSS